MDDDDSLLVLKGCFCEICRNTNDCGLAIWGGLLLLVADCVYCVNRSSRAVEIAFG